jgi:hypothetical protein
VLTAGFWNGKNAFPRAEFPAIRKKMNNVQADKNIFGVEHFIDTGTSKFNVHGFASQACDTYPTIPFGNLAIVARRSRP